MREAEFWLRLQSAIAVVLLAGGYLITANVEPLAFSFNLIVLAVLLSGLTLMATGGGLLLVLYLRGNIRLPSFFRVRPIKRRSTWWSPYQSTEGKVQSAQQSVTDLAASAGVTAQDRAELIDGARRFIEMSLASEVIKTLEERYLAGMNELRRHDLLRAQLVRSANRLKSELTVLTRRGNTNLAIGIATTAVAAALLVYMITGATVAEPSAPMLLAYYVPRVSTVAFIEMFAFFFLRLYRATFADIKYYHNELTNLEAVAVALDAALASGNAQLLQTVVMTCRLSSDHSLLENGTIGVN